MPGVIPALIQDDPEFSDSPSLVLIHDGGGTTINYYFLGDLDRHVWGISNENLVDGDAWPSGINQMAQTYVDLIRSELPRRPLIFGGWSVGGLIAFEMAKIFTGNAEFPVLGVIMIDTFYPSSAHSGIGQDAAVIEWGEATTEESKQTTLKSMANCSVFAQQWGQNTSKGAGVSKSEMPPIVLLRASEDYHAPEAEGDTKLGRGEQMLGWEHYRHDFFSHVLKVPGHHYNLFTEQNVDGLTERLSEACETLEEGGDHLGTSVLRPQSYNGVRAAGTSP